MIRTFLTASIIFLLGSTSTHARADVDVKLWFGAPGYHYVPGYGGVLRFDAHPRRYHGNRHFGHRHWPKRFYGHRPAKPHYGYRPAKPYGWRHDRRHHGHKFDRYDDRRHYGHRHHGKKRYGYRDNRGHRRHRHDSRLRLYFR